VKRLGGEKAGERAYLSPVPLKAGLESQRNTEKTCAVSIAPYHGAPSAEAQLHPFFSGSLCVSSDPETLEACPELVEGGSGREKGFLIFVSSTFRAFVIVFLLGF
jgi:hypothetical protein